MREALRARRRRLDRLWLRRGGGHAADPELLALAESAGLPVEQVPREELEATLGAEGASQGVALRAGPLPEHGLRDLLGDGVVEATQGTRAGRVLVALDGVEDPQNVGAVARVAEATGSLGLVLTERRAPPLSAAVSRASAGAIEWLPVARVGNLGRALDDARSQGFWIVAAELEGGIELYQVEDRLLRGDLVVVLGAEGRGIRPGVLKRADHRVALPMQGRIGSLNVSTAGAVLLYDLLRRARAEKLGPSGEQGR